MTDKAKQLLLAIAGLTTVLLFAGPAAGMIHAYADDSSSGSSGSSVSSGSSSSDSGSGSGSGSGTKDTGTQDQTTTTTTTTPTPPPTDTTTPPTGGPPVPPTGGPPEPPPCKHDDHCPPKECFFHEQNCPRIIVIKKEVHESHSSSPKVIVQQQPYIGNNNDVNLQLVTVCTADYNSGILNSQTQALCDSTITMMHNDGLNAQLPQVDLYLKARGLL
jgi:hypothetical protein